MTNIQFILFGDVMTGDSVWFKDKNSNKIDFVNKLKKLGKVIILKPNYINFMKYSKNYFYKTNYKKIKFNIEDLYFENYSEWIYNQIDKEKKYIAISLDQGCHFAKYFCNQYSNNCIALYVLIDNNFTKQSYEKIFHSEINYNFIKNIVGSKYKKYIIENLTNKKIHKLLKKIKKLKDNEKYIQLLNRLCKGIIRSQYNKITKMNVKTIVYSDSKTLTPAKLQENIDFNKKSYDKIIYYYINDDSEYIIHGKYADEILNNIYGLINFTIYYFNDIEIIKFLGIGTHGTVYLVHNIKTDYKYAMKIEQVFQKDLEKNTKSPIWREIDFAKIMSSKYPQQFMKIYKYKNKKCNYIHNLPNDILLNMPNNQKQYLLKLYASPYCSIKLTSLVDDILHNIIYKLTDKKMILDLFIQVVYIAYLINNEGYYHRDLHPRNIGIINTKDKYIKILDKDILTHGLLLQAIDYGLVIHKKYELEEYEEKIIRYDNDLYVNFNKIIFKIMAKNLIDKYPTININQKVSISNEDSKILDKYLKHIKNNYEYFQELLYKILFFDKFQDQVEITNKVELFDFLSKEDVIVIVKNYYNLKKVLKYLIHKT